MKNKKMTAVKCSRIRYYDGATGPGRMTVDMAPETIQAMVQPEGEYDELKELVEDEIESATGLQVESFNIRY